MVGNWLQQMSANKSNKIPKMHNLICTCDSYCVVLAYSLEVYICMFTGKFIASLGKEKGPFLKKKRK